VVHMTIPATGGPSYIARMTGNDVSFRFLSHNEFAALSDKDKATYLFQAAQELENCQRQIRDQCEGCSPTRYVPKMRRAV
jgi:hypothetical protein